ncbi:MAG TPA: glyoxalase superfamily protein [Caulobacteraceae bacterium]|jgi:hypothetical protein|nr:glyoxalase superfamily protein [Caulobacteraceae bacterium]
MRDFRDAKAMAKSLRAGLAAKGVKITISESLELIARAFGEANWNTLSAAIRAAGETKAATGIDQSNQALDRLANALGLTGWDELAGSILRAREAAPGAEVDSTASVPRVKGPVRFTEALTATLHLAVESAAHRRHGYTTLEHLLLALIEDADAAAVMEACQVERLGLEAKLTDYLDEELKSLVMRTPTEPAPTAGFHRVVQRAVIHVQSSGRREMTGANILVAIFSEQESYAAYLLRQHGMQRLDAVNFIAHGIRKDGRAA